MVQYCYVIVLGSRGRFCARADTGSGSTGQSSPRAEARVSVATFGCSRVVPSDAHWPLPLSAILAYCTRVPNPKPRWRGGHARTQQCTVLYMMHFTFCIYIDVQKRPALMHRSQPATGPDSDTRAAGHSHSLQDGMRRVELSLLFRAHRITHSPGCHTVTSLASAE